MNGRSGGDVHTAVSEPLSPAVDPARFRSALSRFASGVTIVTTREVERPIGMTVSAFCSVSLDPPLVLVALHDRARVGAAIRHSRGFAVSILGAHQEAVSRYFASSDRHASVDASHYCAHPHRKTRSPVIEHCHAYIDCDLHDVIQAGDHALYLGAVTAVGVGDATEPLLYHASHYGSLSPS